LDIGLSSYAEVFAIGNVMHTDLVDYYEEIYLESCSSLV
jgi:hypothetical protein